MYEREGLQRGFTTDPVFCYSLEILKTENRNQSRPNLNLDSILRDPQKTLDVQVLLEVSKEDLNLPT